MTNLKTIKEIWKNHSPLIGLQAIGRRASREVYYPPIVIPSFTDNFEDGVINTNVWSTFSQNGGSVVEANGVLRLYSAPGAQGNSYIQSITGLVIDAGDFELETNINFISPTAFAASSTGAFYLYIYNQAFTDVIWIRVTPATGTNRFWCCFQNNSDPQYFGFQGTVDSLSWTLRIRRVGNVYYAGWNVGSGWTEYSRTMSLASYNSLKVNLTNSNWNTFPDTTIDVAYTNYTGNTRLLT